MADINELNQNITELQSQVQILDAEDTQRKLQKEVEARTWIPITSDMSFITRLKVRIENRLKQAEHLSIVNNATSIIFIISLVSTLLSFMFAKGILIDTATLSLLTGALSESGSFISGKYGVTNSVPTTYVPPIQPEPIVIDNTSTSSNVEDTSSEETIVPGMA
jgi:hypothetical protein